MLSIARLSTADPDFDARFSALVAFESAQDDSVDNAVALIISDVRRRGDAALMDYTKKFDRVSVSSAQELEIPASALRLALESISMDQRDALQVAAARIHSFHERQRIESWEYRESDGTVLGQKVTALDKVGIYVPGGKASYPSTVLMNAIPARVAGVGQIVMTVPTPGGERNPMVLAAAAIAGVDRIFTVGGAQAVAALAYGTSTVPAVDKIVGPGNAYVAAAKRRVFGAVGIDMVAGPSEILVICDGSTDPDWIAMDLFSQAEHDEDAQSILISHDHAFLDSVASSIARLLGVMPRRSVIEASLAARGALILVRDLSEACDIANRICPEHLELSVADPDPWLARLRHAGAIFVGRYSSEAIGDYCAGPNHVLPTSRTSRFSSPLGVYDFQKRTSIIRASAAGADALGRIASTLAHGEGLYAHARSAELRYRQ